MNRNLRFWLLVLTAGVAAVALRLPQLTGPHLIADGDEAILGLMAKRMSEGQGASLFFMGQRFGISFIEAAAAAAAMKVLGPTTLALKLGVFGLWLIGGLFLTLAVRRLGGDRAAVLAAWLLACCPAWGTFALKARGYYDASFMLAHFGLWMTARFAMREPSAIGKRPDTRELLYLGMVSGLLVLSQFIWLLGLLPFVFWMLRRRGQNADLIQLGAGVMVVGLAAGAVLVRQPPAHWAPPAFNNSEGLTAVLALPGRFVGAMGGAYYMREAAKGIFPWIGGLWALALPAAAIRPLMQDSRERPLSPSLLALISVGTIIAFSLANLFNYRYLLPAADFAVILLALELGRLIEAGAGRRALAVGGLAILLVAGAFGMIQMRGLVLAWTVEPQVPSERQALESLIGELEGEQISHVYCLNPTLQWTITFTSGEKVLARWLPPDDRYPPIPEAVDRALREGEPTALVGYIDQMDDVRRALASSPEIFAEPAEIGGRYFILSGPTPGFLERLGFLLNPASPTPR